MKSFITLNLATVSLRQNANILFSSKIKVLFLLFHCYIFVLMSFSRIRCFIKTSPIDDLFFSHYQSVAYNLYAKL